MSHRFPRLRFFQHNPSGPHSVADIIDHVVITVSDFIASLSLTTQNGYIGDVKQFTATAFGSRGQVVNGSAVTWRSDFPNVVSITSTGLATFLASGSATITASVDGRDYATAFVSAQAPDGSHADLVFQIGDASLDTTYDPLLANTNDGAGHVLTVPDVRGTGRNPVVFTAVGNPTLDAVTGEVATDGNASYLQTPEVALFNIGASGTKVFYYIATVAMGGAFKVHSAIQKLDVSHFAEITPTGNGDISVQYEGFGLDAGLGPQVGLVLLIVTFTGQPGATGTLVNPVRTVELPGRLRMVSNANNSGQLPSGNYAWTLGGLKGGGLAGSPERFRAWGSINRPLILADVQALQRRAVARVASLVSALNGLAWVGDSRTWGYPTGPSIAPTVQLATRAGASWSVGNMGAPSRTLGEMVTMAPWLVQQDANPLRARTIPILWGGVNVGTDTPAQALQHVVDWVNLLKTYGYTECVVCTEIVPTPAPTVAVLNPGIIALPGTIPGMTIRVARLDLRSELSDKTNTTYFQLDQLHLTAAGYTVVGNTVADTLGFP